MNIKEKYQIEADGLKVDVRISEEKGELPTYELSVPDCGIATKALLDEIRHELITDVSMSASEILDPREIYVLKEKFRKKATKLLSEKIPDIKEDTKIFLIGTLLHESIGLGKIEFLLNDGFLEEIVINSANEFVRIYHKNYGWLKTNFKMDNEAQIQNFSNIIARRVGR